ncbi:Type I secretion system membrane fusion protein PrsE [Hartmannibacter diazotrophicus]|uniref:Membrane fusion protein (MFP) family protein n=1 Tax=Hartmannibacter diazotrophicus TaxID=1482074 RepID=A0A2C9DC18_9HYPH|nr:HlyD family type I secretion periplasmic adaptor subunit [Hartmannibacter diazotrophicus]SON57806.1 Type I secretion system membrane fusion protein PrsE [Hartmannibacter diazotrophicus]
MTEFDKDLFEIDSSIKKLMRWFLISSLFVLGGIGAWSIMAQVDSAVITAGTFMPESNAQAVQHPEGGVVGEILVREGDLVREGQVLIRLDAAKVRAEMRIQERRLVDLVAERARLQAERLEQSTIVEPVLPVTSEDAEQELRAALVSERGLLAERMFTRKIQASQLQERRTQVQYQIDGLEQRREAIIEEIEQAEGHLADLRQLDTKGLIRRPVLRQSERDVSRLKGDLGDTEARIASARSQLTETEMKIAEHDRGAKSEVLSRLHEIDAQVAEVTEQATAARDRLQRLDLRSPRTGLVHQLAVHTIGGVISPGQVVMSIIPSSEPLVVSASIPPSDIDQVHIGQAATVKISAFKMLVIPELAGKVISMSPDQVVNPKTGQAHFAVKIGIDPEERGKLEGKELTPGLPAEVFIVGESRRVITYLTQPLTEKLELAFREK